MTRLRDHAGFGLIEVVVAILLLAVGIMALSRTGSHALSSQTQSAARTTALDIARKHMEELRSRNPATIDSESPVPVDETGAISSKGKFIRWVAVEFVEDNLKSIKVLVRYPRSQTPIELVTLAYVPPS